VSVKSLPGHWSGANFPYNVAQLKEVGPEWYTQAFHKFGTLPADNSVTQVLDVRQLETTLCMPSGPVATLTSYMRNIVYVSHEDDTVTYRFLTLREMNAIKSFDSESLRYLRTLPFNAACSVIASAIPARMLEAVYRTASACILPEQQPCQALKTVGTVRSVKSIGPRQHKLKYAPKAGKFGWKPMADPKTRRYAVKKWSIDRYHKRTHRSRDLIENDILAGLLKLEPGDTRYMTPCVLCWLNKDHLRARHFNLDWHHNELVYGPAEGWHLDVYYLTVKSKLDGYAYIFIFVDIDSGFIIDIGTHRLDIETVISVLTSFMNRVTLELGAKVKLVYGDFFATFKEKYRLTLFKKANDMMLEVNSPYRHFRNLVENILRWLRHVSVVKLASIKGQVVTGRQVNPDEFMPEAVRHSACVSNDASSSSMLRKFDRRTSPRTRASRGKSRRLPLHEFFASAAFILPHKNFRVLTKEDGQRT
jgi:hypothetical protein